MKLFSSLLVILILAMHLAPCSDLLVSLEANHTHESVQNAADQHPQKSLDQCNPFCMCACCAIPLILQAKPAVALYSCNYPPTFTRYASPKVDRVTYPIWQPPRLLS